MSVSMGASPHRYMSNEVSSNWRKKTGRAERICTAKSLSAFLSVAFVHFDLTKIPPCI